MKRLITIAVAAILLSGCVATPPQLIDQMERGNLEVMTLTSPLTPLETADVLENQVTICWDGFMTKMGIIRTNRQKFSDTHIRVIVHQRMVIDIDGNVVTAYATSKRLNTVANRDFTAWVSGDLSCKPVGIW